MVLASVDDWLAGRRLPLDAIHWLPSARRRPERMTRPRSSSACPAASIRRSPRCCCSARANRSPACSCRTGKKTIATGHAAPMPTARMPSRCARRLGIPLYARNFAAEYWDQVFAHFLDEYRRRAHAESRRAVQSRDQVQDLPRSRACARRANASRPATTRAPIASTAAGACCARATPSKDQSYFLHALGQEALAATLFPLGELHKSEVRQLAREAGLPTHAKKDSTGICFIGERDFRAFLVRLHPGPTRARCARPTASRSASIAGVFYYTLGQRNGLGIGGRRDAGGEPWYVVGKDISTQRADRRPRQRQPLAAFAPARRQRPDLDRRRGAGREFRCTAKTRYRQADQACQVAIAGNTCVVDFDAAAARGDAGPVGRVLRRRRVPRRRRHRAHRRTVRRLERSADA